MCDINSALHYSLRYRKLNQNSHQVMGTQCTPVITSSSQACTLSKDMDKTSETAPPKKTRRQFAGLPGEHLW